MRRFVALLLCATVPLLRSGLIEGEEPERHPLLRIGDPEDPGRDDALAAWKELSDAERTKRTREALRSEAPALALAAAVVASPWSLDLEELRFRSHAMQRDPLAWLEPPTAISDLADGYKGYGAPDLAALWRACVAKDPTVERMSDARLHRVLLPEQVPDLVPLLETAGPVAFRALLDDIRLLAESVGERGDQEAYVRAFRYGLLRLRAEHAKQPRPRFVHLPVHISKSGVPGEFLELARGCWAGDGRGFELGGLPEEAERDGLRVTAAHVRGPDTWMHRWALRLAPAADDAPALVEVLESRAPGVTKAWAARHIAALEGRAAGHARARALAPGGGGELVWAAAEVATRGDRSVWDDLASATGLGKEGAGALAEARWYVDPVAARAAAWKALQEGDLPKELETEARWFLVEDFGVEIAAEHLDWIAARLMAGEAPIATEMAFFAEVHPDWLTPERAGGLAKRWSVRAASVQHLNAEQVRAIALLEPFAPEATRALLRAVAEQGDEEYASPAALDLLMRLGDAALADRMMADWPQRPWSDAAMLGRVRTPGVEAFLRERVEGRAPKPAEGGPRAGEIEPLAVQALAILYGCPELLARFLGPYARKDEELTPETWAEAKRLVLAKDPIGAVLRRTWSGPFVEGVSNTEMCGFGLAKDPRVVARLELWREHREFQLYWLATACLAAQGEERARTEWRGFLADARTFLLDHFQVWPLFTLDGGPEWTSFWVARLDANCCYGWHAQECVKAAFPTFPFSHLPAGAGATRRGAERWFERHRGTFVRSPILDGWIPGPRK